MKVNLHTWLHAISHADNIARLQKRYLPGLYFLLSPSYTFKFVEGDSVT